MTDQQIDLHIDAILHACALSLTIGNLSKGVADMRAAARAMLAEERPHREYDLTIAYQRGREDSLRSEK